MWPMFDYTALRLNFHTTSSPLNPFSSHCCVFSVLLTPLGLFLSNAPLCFFILLLLAVLLLHVSFPTSSTCTSWPSFSPCYILCLIHIINPSFLYFLLLFLFLFISHTGLLLPCQCQSLCEFYANHCARIEALRRQLQEEQRGRQVEHTATAGLGWYCSWDVISNVKSYVEHTAFNGRSGV